MVSILDRSLRYAPAMGHDRVGAEVAPTSPMLIELFTTFVVVGVSAVGMGIMQAIRSVPVERGWMSQEDIDEGMGLVQLYPGAIMVDLITYIGYRLRGIRGALVSVVAFVGPSLVLLLGLSWAFFTYKSHPVITDLAVGVEALVVGVLVNLTIDFGAEHASGRLTALVALGAFAVEVAGQNVLWAVLGALVIGALALSPGSAKPGAAQHAGRAPAAMSISWSRLALATVPGLVVVAGAVVAAASPGALAAVSAAMAKIGAVAFGNGTAIMPLLQQSAVEHHWLTLRQFGVGVGLGQVTPGPFLSTAAFVGYGAAGWWGGIAGGLAIYAPSVAMTMVVAEIYPVFRRLTWVRGAIMGVMAAFTGLLAGMVLVLGRPVLSVPAAVGLAGAAFVAVRVLKWNMLLVFAAGLCVWIVYLVLGGTA
jgi:chromate transporter